MVGCKTIVFAAFAVLLCMCSGQVAGAGRARGAWPCDAIQRSDSPCVLLDVPVSVDNTMSEQNVLSAGTPVELRFTRTLRARDFNAHSFGQRVEFEVMSDVVVGGQTVVAAGEKAWGAVAAVKPPGRFAAPGGLSIRVEGVHAITDAIVPLTGSMDVAGEVTGCADEGGCVLGLLLIGAFVKGEDVIVPKGQSLSATVAQTTIFDRASLAEIPVIHEVREELQHARDHDKGLILVYRLSDDGCRGVKTTNGHSSLPIWCGKARLHLDGGASVPLSAGYSLQFEVDPGEHRLRALNGQEMVVRVAAGAAAYVRVELSAGWRRPTQMIAVPTDTGERESYPLDSRTIVGNVVDMTPGP